jgi:hypothetical protein
VTVTRQLPAQFDLSASTVLAGGDALRLATQIRQDLWRALQSMRGFSPVVEVTLQSGGVHVRAGGRVAGRIPANAAERIEAMLVHSGNRARWMRCAGFRGAL